MIRFDNTVSLVSIAYTLGCIKRPFFEEWNIPSLNSFPLEKINLYKVREQNISIWTNGKAEIALDESSNVSFLIDRGG